MPVKYSSNQHILFQLLRNNKVISVHNTYLEAKQAKFDKYDRELENLEGLEQEQFDNPNEMMDVYTIKPIEII